MVTSIGEPTTELCIWALDRLGYTVDLYQGKQSLAEKLALIYHDMTDDFLRVDADVIVNKQVLKLGEYEKDAWWIQGLCFGWYSQGIIHGGVQLIRKGALPALRANILNHMNAERPESDMFRLPEFHHPRRCVSSDVVCGIHGWGQNDLKRVKEVKTRRNQLDNYDFELVERMNAL